MLRRIGLVLGLCLLFVRVSFIHQIIAFETGVNSRLLYIFGIPTLIAVIGTGALRRTFRGVTGIGWLGFIAWMIISVAFSTWPTGSAELAGTYLRTSLPILFVTAGFAITWKDCERVMYCVGAAGVVNVLGSKLFEHDDSGRLSLDFGSIANSNDLAAHLLFVLPFVLYMGVKPGSNFLLKIVSGVSLLWTLYIIVGTASRGALLALAAVTVVLLINATMPQKIVILVAGMTGAVALISVTPPETLRRITSFSSSSKSADEEALASSEARAYLLRNSIDFTLHNPIFGVGPGQFNNEVGKLGRDKGIRIWQETHNFFTQISSECGIPALLFYLTAVGAAIGRVVSTMRRAGRRPEYRRVRRMAFCLLLAMTGFGVSSLFLNLAYQFYWLVLSGVAVCMAEAAQAEFFSKEPAPAPRLLF